MAGAMLSIKRWGNSLGVRLPVSVSSKAHLHVDQQVCIEVVDDHLVITPITDTPKTLEQRLESFDPARHGGEEMTVKAVGAEIW